MRYGHFEYCVNLFAKLFKYPSVADGVINDEYIIFDPLMRFNRVIRHVIQCTTTASKVDMNTFALLTTLMAWKFVRTLNVMLAFDTVIKKKPVLDSLMQMSDDRFFIGAMITSV
ncbi:hypothetical protein HCAG_02044 [Histoplasma mississippiense (nom. inval.)]|uniref:hypothetical protein n=1 Tax=Ajellomyces capsulatus (strain NAm1 / WU24) TaxID=2059318 RepID=UPI000157BB3D|nr:hypothetical protein HCAG_02044 [Histoplasma mississippiense (nom. inval.)]EDN04179.1 hypothetical protein HCAG_02044 [Histoplasma mississippiense (nom. inval.)]